MSWLDGWERIPGNDSGSWASGPLAPKLLLHTTEGSSIDGAVGAYRANNSWPHVTVDPVRRRRVQHLPLDRPARALRNTSTPGQTNRSPRVIQVEIVGRAADTPHWSDDRLVWLGTDVVGPLCDAGGIPLVCGVTFYGLDAGFTLASTSARQRLSRAAWDTYEGVLGHQHAPENTHWDPGAIPIDRILAAATNNPENTMNAAQEAKLDQILEVALDARAEARAAGLRSQAVEERLYEALGDERGPFLPRLIAWATRNEPRIRRAAGEDE